MIQASEPVSGDVPIFNLIIQVLHSIYANRFFDSDSQLKVVIPILMNITLCSRFNRLSSLRSIILVKDLNALLLSQLIEKFHQKYELKVGYAEFLVKQMMADDADELCIYGCLACLARFGPYINRKLLLPNLPAIRAMLQRRLESGHNETEA